MRGNLLRGLPSCKFLFSVALVFPAISPAQSLQPLTLVGMTALPEITGDFDHFAVDLKRNRLFVAAEEHHTLEMFDLKTGKHLQSIGGVKTPHSIAYVPEKDELFIADGDDSACVVLSASDFHQVDRIPLAAGPDAALYDPATKRFYVGNGGRSAKQETSTITIISVDDHKKVADISIDGNNVESMAVDPLHHRLFVNIRDKKEIGVVDLTSNKTVAKWTTPEMNRNTPLRFDEANQRVFVAGRTPGKFFVFNAADGTLVQTSDCVEIADDMTWDPTLRRIYITGSQGVSIFKQQTKDHYTQVIQMPTNGGKTSIYVPELKQFYIVHPKTTIDNAGLLVYRVNP